MKTVTLTVPEALRRAVAAYNAGRFAEAEQFCKAVLSVKPDDIDALHLQAVVSSRTGRTADALTAFARVLALQPDHAEALNNQGNTLKELKRYDDALASFERALAARPDYAEALTNRGNTLREMNRLDDALESYESALTVRPDYVEALYNRANTLRLLKRRTAAAAAYERTLGVRPEFVEALTNYGAVLCDLGRPTDALALFERALALRPDYVEALTNRGNVLQALNRHDEALASYDAALKVRPDYAEAYNNRGAVLQDLNRFEEALASFDRALALRADYAEALNNRGITFAALRRFEEALASYERALALRPAYAEALNNRGNTLYAMKRMEQALASFDGAIASRPDYPEAFNNRGNVLLELKRFAQAIESYQKALALRPEYPAAKGGLADAALRICDWPLVADIAADLPRLAGREVPIVPFVLLGYTDDPKLHLACAKAFIEKRFGTWPHAPLWQGERWRNERIRIAYVSSDFKTHPVAALTAELFETHDRSRVEVLGFSIGHDDRSEMRKRLARAFDQFHDVALKSDRDIAEALNRAKVDIAVDLNGHTLDSRTAIFACRPAPIQVSYLGYPGTCGADFIDYIIADEVVLPFGQAPFYTEKIVHLPGSFVVNDTQRKISAAIPSRRELGLPEKGFVFCCFNNSYKLNPAMFDVWMRLLRKVEGSVLWLSQHDKTAAENLRREAVARSVDPRRLIFASRVPLPEDHLARHVRADLFLDTLPYNAHTTTGDALWAGLPVLTCTGKSFAGRVAASQLRAIGLPELVTANLADYEALALRFAMDPARLAAARAKLRVNRLTTPLFDTRTFCSNIEAAYFQMWQRWQQGRPPEHFAL